MIRRVVLVSVFASVLAALVGPATAQVAPMPRPQLPDGDSRPTVVSARVADPGRHNALLEADLEIEAVDNDGIASYEYRWNRSGYGTIRQIPVEYPTVSYIGTEPETPYALQVRAVDLNGWRSDWFTAFQGATPSTPHLVVAGDSIASGYTKRWFTGDATCLDAGLSYGATVAEEVSSRLPDAWAPRYTNISWAGAGVGSMLNGGTDSCGRTHPPQVDQIAALADDASWNLVVVTAGINSTNWTDVVVGLTRDTAFSFSKAGDREACELAVDDDWNIDERRGYVTSTTATVATRILRDTNARVAWTGYYDLTGTRLAPAWSPIGEECDTQMKAALAELHEAIQAGLPDDVTWVDIDGDVSTQGWAGWPHPDAGGHRLIGHTVAAAILG